MSGSLPKTRSKNNHENDTPNPTNVRKGAPKEGKQGGPRTMFWLSFPDPRNPGSPNGPGPPQTAIFNDFRSHFDANDAKKTTA